MSEDKNFDINKIGDYEEEISSFQNGPFFFNL